MHDAAPLAINLDNDQSVTVPDRGRGPPATRASFTEALQLTIGGIVFSVLLAMAALGLSMIFGTTGLTNFAHGELDDLRRAGGVRRGPAAR